MVVPVILFVLSVLAMAAAWALPDLFILATLCAVASGIVLLRTRHRSKKPPNWIVVDGSNVMYWNGGIAKLETLIAVLKRLHDMGFVPGVMLDANAGHVLEGRYCGDAAMARILGVPHDRVMVMNKGVPADGLVLKSARDLKARIVTNDRFRDWAGDYPEVAIRGHLVQGGYRDGKLWLDLDD